jgi:hypothetical protein
MFRRTATASAAHPTAKLMTDLAILLAQELSHLVLSHHLEMLSLITIFIPGVLSLGVPYSLVSDSIRAFVFPITMLFGPFVNDTFTDLRGHRPTTFLMGIALCCQSPHVPSLIYNNS